MNQIKILMASLYCVDSGSCSRPLNINVDYTVCTEILKDKNAENGISMMKH